MLYEQAPQKTGYRSKKPGAFTALTWTVCRPGLVSLYLLPSKSAPEHVQPSRRCKASSPITVASFSTEESFRITFSVTSYKRQACLVNAKASDVFFSLELRYSFPVASDDCCVFFAALRTVLLLSSLFLFSHHIPSTGQHLFYLLA